MTFPFNIYLLSFAAAALLTFLTMPGWSRFCRARHLVDEPGPRKLHAASIPLAGGLAILGGLLLPLLTARLVLVFASGETEAADRVLYGFQRRGLELLGVFLGAIGMVILGLIDDRYELGPSLKFAGQLFMALLVAAFGVRITLFVPNAIFSYAVTVLWILTVTNAFNFVDNTNGLSAGLGMVSSILLAVFSAQHGQYLVGALACLIAGSVAGFLPYNFPKASAFLGDSGSHLVGYLLAVLTILPHFHTAKDPRPWAVLSPLLILALPLLDLVWVVVWRWRAGRPFYQGDTNHLSHQLMRRGFKASQAVLLLWLASALIGSLIFLLP